MSIQGIGGLRGGLMLVSLLTASLAMAAPDTAFKPQDVFELAWAADPQISPDGRQIVYVRMSMDVKTDRARPTLWLVDVASGRETPIAVTDAGTVSPRWSPDGSRIAYVAQRAEEGRQLFVYWLAGGASAAITHLAEEPEALAWAPDGRQLAFTMPAPAVRKPLEVTLPQPPKDAKWAEVPKYIDRVVYRADGGGYLPDAFSQVFVVDAAGGAARQLTSGDFDHTGPLSFTPDGTRLVITANRRADAQYEPLDSEVYSLSLSDGSLRALTDRRGPDMNPVVSPDGRHIAYLGFDDRQHFYQVTQLYVMDPDGRNVRSLTAGLDRDAGSPQWSADSGRLYFQYEDHGSGRIASVDLAGHLTVLANDLGGVDVTRPYGGGAFSIARDGRFAYTRASPLAPAARATGRRPADIRTLTRLNDNLLNYRSLGSLEELKFDSRFDRREMQGWLVTPPGFDAKKKYPLLLEIHGGPVANYGPRFAAEMQLYAAAGYVVLYMNPRGSDSYGEAFGDLIHRDYPDKDYEDLMSGVDTVLARGFVDPARLFVTGGSGGGVLTAWIVGHTDRFRAAVVAKPVINWTSFVLTADGSNFFYRYWFGAFPWEDREGYWRRSPLAYVDKVVTPTMLMTGEVDYRTPSGEAEQFYEALKLRKVDTALVRVPGASHDISARPSHLIAKVAYILAWFRNHDVPPPAKN
ncbi:MAG: S9 family peptidase [Steroidobacteraceae bacterium]